MGRRSLHSAEELRHIILSSSRHIMEREGIGGLSARAIAKEIGYSPGTLYNVFENLDDLVLTIEIAMLDECTEAMRSVPSDTDAAKHVCDLVDCYMRFASTNRQLWTLLFQNMPPTHAKCGALKTHFDVIIDILRDALQPLFTKQPNAAKHAAHMLWFAVHGMSAVVVTNDIPDLPHDAAIKCAHDFAHCIIGTASAQADT